VCMKTVGEVAELAHVSVRTLHHYHELGLLAPSERSESGYRLYSYDDVARLQEILIWRQLGFSLAEIKSLLDDPEYDRIRALERHREHISRRFYPCSPQMHRGLAEMYIADERFTRTYEREAEGLAAYFHDAIVANADASEAPGAGEGVISR
jgi:DNA-binding transcriptional MerR regulator